MPSQEERGSRRGLSTLREPRRSSLAPQLANNSSRRQRGGERRYGVIGFEVEEGVAATFVRMEDTNTLLCIKNLKSR